MKKDFDSDDTESLLMIYVLQLFRHKNPLNDGRTVIFKEVSWVFWLVLMTIENPPFKIIRICIHSQMRKN